MIRGRQLKSVERGGSKPVNETTLKGVLLSPIAQTHKSCGIQPNEEKETKGNNSRTTECRRGG